MTASTDESTANKVIPPEVETEQRSGETKMADGHTLISYSRKQYYFAESLALNLQDNGVQTWFDMQNLKPGREWAADLQAGLETCENVVLVASRASIASEYVRAEWTHALKANKPVYVVIFEAVELPSELHNAPVFDSRSNFNRNLDALAGCIKVGKAQRGDVPKPNRLFFPTKTPVSVWLVSLALASAAILLLATPIALYLFELRESFFGDVFEALAVIVSLALTWAAMTGMFAYCWWAFVYRRVDYADMLACLGAAPIILWMNYRSLSGLTDFLDHEGSLALSMSNPPIYAFELFFPAFVVVSLLNWGAFLLVFRTRSADLLRAHLKIAICGVRCPKSLGKADLGG